MARLKFFEVARMNRVSNTELKSLNRAYDGCVESCKHMLGC